MRMLMMQCDIFHSKNFIFKFFTFTKIALNNKILNNIKKVDYQH